MRVSTRYAVLPFVASIVASAVVSTGTAPAAHAASSSCTTRAATKDYAETVCIDFPGKPGRTTSWVAGSRNGNPSPSNFRMYINGSYAGSKGPSRPEASYYAKIGYAGDGDKVKVCVTFEALGDVCSPTRTAP